MATKTHGGRRKNAGRKPVKDPKVQISIYPHTSQIKKMGGEEKAKALIIRWIEGYEK